MRIITKSGSTIPAEGVQLIFVPGTGVRFIREAGVESMEVGAGTLETMDRRGFMQLIRKTVRNVRDQKITTLVLSLSDLPFPKLKDLPPEERVFLAASNALIGGFEFIHYKTTKKERGKELDQLVLLGVSGEDVEMALTAALHLGAEVNASRVLSNTPGGDMTPTVLAKAAISAAKGTPIKVTVLGKKELQQQKMGAVLGVARGSREEPKFIVMEYWGAGKPQGKQGEKPHARRTADQNNPIVLIGKGVTFDTGGLNLKPSDGILEMHMDMSGGAVVIHTLTLAAKLKLKKDIIGLIPAVENMPSGESYRPGDILHSASGKTIEVLNTDAEGRLILADAITYAKRYQPRLVVDVATLTGAAMVALGQHACAVLTPNKKLEDALREAGDRSGDRVWPLPLWNEYEQYVRGNFADVANIPGVGSSRYGGVIHGGMFLYQFAKDLGDVPWAHIDMAPRMTPAPNEPLAKGATGEPLRLLFELIQVY